VSMAAQLPRCEICGLLAMRHPHHIVSRGSGGSDDPANLIPLCQQHHTEAHTLGVDTWAANYGLHTRVARAREAAWEQ
jgi:hypothetical protein